MSPILWAIWSQEASFSRNNLTPVRRTRQPPANWTRQGWVEDRLKAELRTNFQARRNPVGVREAPFHCICSLAPLAGFRGRRPRSPQGQRVRVRG